MPPEEEARAILRLALRHESSLAASLDPAFAQDNWGFLAQQCVENLLKGFIVLADRQPPLSHDLGRLQQLAGVSLPEDLLELGEFAVKARTSPEDTPLPSSRERLLGQTVALALGQGGGRETCDPGEAGGLPRGCHPHGSGACGRARLLLPAGQAALLRQAVDEQITGQGQGGGVPTAQPLPEGIGTLPEDQHQIQIAADASVAAAVRAKHVGGQHSTDPGEDEAGMKKGLFALQSAEMFPWRARWELGAGCQTNGGRAVQRRVWVCLQPCRGDPRQHQQAMSLSGTAC